MVDVTVFELHVPNAKFNAPFAGRGDGSADEEEIEIGTSSRGSLAALAVLIGFALLAYYLRRSSSSSDSPLPGSDDGPL